VEKSTSGLEMWGARVRINAPKTDVPRAVLIVYRNQYAKRKASGGNVKFISTTRY
jgi:hypothetical protein